MSTVCEHFQQKAAGAVADWDGQDSTDLLRLLYERTGDPAFRRALAAPGLLDICRETLRAGDDTWISVEDWSDEWKRIHDQCVEAIAVAEGSGEIAEMTAAYGAARRIARLEAENTIYLAALDEAHAGLLAAGADQIIPEGAFVPAPTLALGAVRHALAVAGHTEARP